MVRSSVTVRLAVAVVILEAVLIATASAFIYFESREFFRRYFDTGLAARAESIASLIDNTDTGLRMDQPIWPINRRQPDSSRPDLYWVWADSGDSLLGSPPLPGRDEVLEHCPAPPRPGRQAFFNLTRGARNYRAVWIRPVIPPAPTTATAPENDPALCNILLAVSREPMDRASTDLIEWLLIVGGIAMAVTAAVTVMLLRWGLSPVHRAARHISGITAANIGSNHLQPAEAPREVQPFVTALDDLLARLAAAFRQQRNFTAYASHELRTPMAIIKSTIQTCLLRQRQPQEYCEALAEVLDDLTRMEHIVDQLLLLAKLDAQVEQPGQQTIDLGDLVTDVLQRYHQLAAEAGVTLESPELSPAPVKGNSDLLERMLANLIGNAIQHNRPGGTVHVRCGLSQESQPGRRVVTVEVADTGPGIPADALGRIFERFFRVDKARSRSVGGSGLGLAIVQEIVQRHGGSVTAENRPAGGALFRLQLPAD